MENERGGVSLEIPTEDAPVACWMLWLAFGEALRMLGETQGNSGWREALYERTQSMFDTTKSEQRGDQSLFARRGVNASESAIRSGAKAIDAAFDRVKFR